MEYVKKFLSFQEMIVAKYLLMILHGVFQVVIILAGLYSTFTEQPLAILLIPVGMILLRFYFELIAVVFSISNNVNEIRDAVKLKK